MAGPRLAVAHRAFRDRRRGRFWWVLGSVLYCLAIVAAFPAMKGQQDINRILQDYPPELLALFAGGETTFDLASAADYLNSQLFALVAPLLLTILAIGFAAATLAGEEERGTLDLVLSYPVTRASVVLQKALVLVAEVVVLAAVIYLVTFGVGRAFEVDVPLRHVTASSLGQVLLGVLFGLIALAAGAASGSRSLAIAVGGGSAAATYLVGSLAPVVSWLGPFKWISPFFYATGENPLVNGLPLWRVVVLAGTAVVFLGAAVVAFERRDLRG
ncbi:ABC transporter permease subunit [Rhabdothermincola sp.]|uniref:ABC transporter permease subunit n=1 Tax=Rhabdothermincola sp. TaxID=2820405 RepID=UPI002FE1803B